MDTRMMNLFYSVVDPCLNMLYAFLLDEMKYDSGSTNGQKTLISICSNKTFHHLSIDMLGNSTL